MVLSYYKTSLGREPLIQWLDGLKDRAHAARIRLTLVGSTDSTPADIKYLKDGLWEIRFHFGPGYRIYFARFAGAQRKPCLLLLIGGTKRTQSRDIRKARHYLADWRNQAP
jgi:putative addiction module killer protein